MRKYFTFVLLPLMYCCPVEGQQNKKYHIQCDVYQFSKTDSLNKFISLTQFFNQTGQIVSETYKGYMTSAYDGTADGTYYYFYKDTLLVKRTSSINFMNDSTKTLYYYNKRSLLVKQEHFDFQRRLKKGVTGDLLSDDDFEKKRIWKKTSIVRFSYDNNNNKILYDATKLHYSSQNKYTWSYDDLGRVLKYSSFDNEHLIWIEEYSYYDGYYMFTRTWYDEYGQPRQLKDKWEYWAQNTYICKLNPEGQVIEERAENEKGKFVKHTETTYNSQGLIEKFISFDENAQPEITHIYVYKSLLTD